MSSCGNIKQDFQEAAEAESSESSDYTPLAPLHDDCTTATDYVASAVTNLASSMSSMTATLSAKYPSSAPPLVEGDVAREYAIRETIAQGWLHKKGSGGDWAKQRWWKPRWMTLALATKADGKADGSDAVLILLSHRAPGVPYPVGILELTKSTVVMASEKRLKTEPDACGDAWNRHCFSVVQAGSESSQTRVFTAPLEDRNEWVFALNQALINQGKRQEARARPSRHRMNFASTRNVMDVDDEVGRINGTRSRNSRARSPSPAKRSGDGSIITAGGRPPTSPTPLRLPTGRITP